MVFFLVELYEDNNHDDHDEHVEYLPLLVAPNGSPRQGQEQEQGPDLQLGPGWMAWQELQAQCPIKPRSGSETHQPPSHNHTNSWPAKGNG